MALTTPEVALRPNSVPCGPRSTSTRSRSKNSVSNRRVENSGSPLRWIAVALSQVVPTHRSPIPRIVKLAPVKLVLVKVTFGRSEEHTSELQSLMRISYAVFCLKKKKNIEYHKKYPQ